ncbi:oxysterol-binding protein-like protein [Galdieria sulphuraria]|uniref:Oxysterol-binding protein-like protein n=1 Tax=Galdieria sulphuraria TaxID=130081 RepID=M2X857_GALSU|nr:oxysterol-binding protein-like protein [Galdieria sulphuraria]EME32745.1 oxysterol-binding protein-like protein [Galdieria sulphuraria]|eukprot:XP_005709265.1 oxysterol-binding protein-like protein [Galdieria sulphuraria]
MIRGNNAQHENSDGGKSPTKRSHSGKFLKQVNEVANAAIAPIKSAFEFLTNTAVSGLICDDQLAREWQQRNQQSSASQVRHSDDGLQRRKSVPLNSSSNKVITQTLGRKSTGAIHKDRQLDSLLSPHATSPKTTLLSTSNLEETDEEDDNISYYTCADTPGIDSKTEARTSFATDLDIFEEISEVPIEPSVQLSSEQDTKTNAQRETTSEGEYKKSSKKSTSTESIGTEKRRFHRYASFSAAHDDFRRGSGDHEALAEAASEPGFEMASASTLRKQALRNNEPNYSELSHVASEEHLSSVSVANQSADTSSSLPMLSGHSQERRLASYPNDAEPVTPDGYRVKDEFLDEVGPPQNMSFFRIVREVFKDVRKGGDLTSISVPASLLEPVSACEKVTRIMQRGELLQEIIHCQEPLERFLQVVRFILSGLPKEKFSKKPYNPILGETFQCAFEHRNGGGRTFLISEQVSHHPPITAVHLRNDTLGIRMTSYTEPEAKFWGNSIEIKLKGKIRFYLVNFDEEYVSNRTSLILSGILGIGKFRAEWRGPLHIYCEKTGYEAKLEFKGTALMGFLGEANAVDGKIVRRQKEGTSSEVSEQKLFSVEGSWDHQIRIKDVIKKENRILFDYDDISKHYRMKLLLPPPEALEETNSLYVWEGCTRAILEGNSRLAAEEKHKVEEEQRRLRRERMQRRIEWEPKYFRLSSEGEGYVFREETAENLFHDARNMCAAPPSPR